MPSALLPFPPLISLLLPGGLASGSSFEFDVSACAVPAEGVLDV